MTIKELQFGVEILYAGRGYDAEVRTLLLGAMSDLGKLAQAILLTECEDFKPSAKKLSPAWADARDPARQIGDTITYLLALCNRLGIEPYFKWLSDDAP